MASGPRAWSLTRCSSAQGLLAWLFRGGRKAEWRRNTVRGPSWGSHLRAASHVRILGAVMMLEVGWLSCGLDPRGFHSFPRLTGGSWCHAKLRSTLDVVGPLGSASSPGAALHPGRVTDRSLKNRVLCGPTRCTDRYVFWDGKRRILFGEGSGPRWRHVGVRRMRPSWGRLQSSARSLLKAAVRCGPNRKGRRDSPAVRAGSLGFPGTF